MKRKRVARHLWIRSRFYKVPYCGYCNLNWTKRREKGECHG